MQICPNLEPPYAEPLMCATSTCAMAQRTVQKYSVWPVSLVFGKGCTTFQDRIVEPVDVIQHGTPIWLLID